MCGSGNTISNLAASNGSGSSVVVSTTEHTREREKWNYLVPGCLCCTCESTLCALCFTVCRGPLVYSV